MFIYFQDKTINTLKTAFRYGWIGKRQYLMTLNIHKYKGILTCEICKEPINSNNDNRRLSIDHIHPKYKGGNNDIDNLRITHRKCNSCRKV